MVVFVDLTLTQKQGLSPAMQTSMHLLQMNNLQLRTYIADLMYRNPVVELECPEIDFKPNPFERSRSTRTNHLSDQQDGRTITRQSNPQSRTPCTIYFCKAPLWISNRAMPKSFAT